MKVRPLKLPISLLPIISKVFQPITNVKLVQQEYFLLKLISDQATGPFDGSGKTRTIALDISKALNKVWHTGLLHTVLCQWPYF